MSQDKYGRTTFCVKVHPTGNDCKMLQMWWGAAKDVPQGFEEQYQLTGGKICPGGTVGGGMNRPGTPEYDLCYGETSLINAPPPPSPSPPSATCSGKTSRDDKKGKWREKKCPKYKKRGKCCKKKAQRKCLKSCCGGKSKGQSGDKCKAFVSG